jgi:KEOPS complex subunit Cgi121
LVYVVEVNEVDMYIAVGGFRNVQVDSVDSLLAKVRKASRGVEFQLFNARYIAGQKHLVHAALNALYAHNAGSGVSRSISMESMLYASCQDQISEAIKLLGITEGIHNIAVLVFNETHEGAETGYNAISSVFENVDDSVLDIDETKHSEIIKAYRLKPQESSYTDRDDALTWILVEKGALLRARR